MTSNNSDSSSSSESSSDSKPENQTELYPPSSSPIPHQAKSPYSPSQSKPISAYDKLWGTKSDSSPQSQTMNESTTNHHLCYNCSGYCACCFNKSNKDCNKRMLCACSPCIGICGCLLALPIFACFCLTCGCGCLCCGQAFDSDFHRTIEDTAYNCCFKNCLTYVCCCFIPRSYYEQEFSSNRR